jgi:lysine-specific demethylase 8
LYRYSTVTPLHRDPYHNVLCQVWGTKLVRMYRAADAPSLYPFPGGFLRNTSQVDVEAVVGLYNLNLVYP